MKLVYCLLFILPLDGLAQDWSDTLDLEKGDLKIFQADNTLYGFKRKGKEKIPPLFQDGYSFHDKRYTSVKVKGKWGLLKKNGKLVGYPWFELMSPVVDGYYIAYMDSTFSIRTVRGELIRSDKFLTVDFAAYFDLLKESKNPDLDLILRVVAMYGTSPRNCSENEDLELLFSKLIMKHYWSTKWALEQFRE